MDWDEKVECFIDVKKPKIKKRFSRIKEIRTNVRNIPLHESSVCLFDIEGVGQIPRVYEENYQPQKDYMSSYVYSTVSRQNDTLNILAQWEKIFRSKGFAQYGYRYAQTGDPICLDESKINIIRKRFRKDKKFRRALDRTNIA